MGKRREHYPVKLITGFIFQNETCLKKAQEYLTKRFGKIDFESQVLPFIHTGYYEKEFGKGLKRKFISFSKLIGPVELARIKIFTNNIENKLSQNNKRTINIDPGYLDLAKLILATTKDYNHRVYLNQGIYAEVTLSFKDKTFSPWEWTYPDYKTKEYLSIFHNIRDIFANQRNK